MSWHGILYSNVYGIIFSWLYCSHCHSFSPVVTAESTGRQHDLAVSLYDLMCYYDKWTAFLKHFCTPTSSQRAWQTDPFTLAHRWQRGSAMQDANLLTGSDLGFSSLLNDTRTGPGGAGARTCNPQVSERTPAPPAPPSPIMGRQWNRKLSIFNWNLCSSDINVFCAAMSTKFELKRASDEPMASIGLIASQKASRAADFSLSTAFREDRPGNNGAMSSWNIVRQTISASWAKQVVWYVWTTCSYLRWKYIWQIRCKHMRLCVVMDTRRWHTLKTKEFVFLVKVLQYTEQFRK